MARPIKVGVTGSIAMGKSAVTKFLRFLGFAVFDADSVVHQLYGPKGAAAPLLQPHFPAAVREGGVDRSVLSQYVVKDAEAMKRLESIIHPLVQQERELFYNTASRRKDFIVFYDIPLLYEIQAEREVDYVMVVSASAATQRQRALQRSNMTPEKFEAILKKQLPDEEKRVRADFVIYTDFEGYSQSRAQITNAISTIITLQPSAWKAFLTPEPGDIQIIIFDLDDTLVPTQLPVRAANAALDKYMQEHMPLTHSTLQANPDALRNTMKKIKLEQKWISHDFTELRRLSLIEHATPHNEQHHVSAAMEIFLKKRSDVDEYLYSDALPCIAHLSTSYKLAIMTNGNAELSRSALRPYLVDCLNAVDVAASKPSPLAFLPLLLRHSIHPSRALYIGDDYDNDVIGASALGMHTALLQRNEIWNSEGKTVIPNIFLSSLAIDEVTAKIDSYMSSQLSRQNSTFSS